MRFLRRKSSDLFAFIEMLVMWAFHQRSEVMVIHVMVMPVKQFQIFIHKAGVGCSVSMKCILGEAPILRSCFWRSKKSDSSTV